MILASDDVGLWVDVPALDPANPRAAELLSCLDRGDVDQMSFAFMPTRQEWNADYTQRRILELKLVDVSAVTYPANTATIIAARAASSEPVRRSGLPLSLALAQAAAIA
jgi:HK97 family phage prohead protease